jgi:hypothetical protein
MTQQNPNRGTPTTYRLHVITTDGQTYAVGPRGMDYYDVYIHYGRRVTDALHAGLLPGIKSINIVADVPAHAAPEVPAHLMVPGTVFPRISDAGRAIAEHLEAVLDDWLALAERMIGHGVLEPLPDQPGVLVLLEVPRKRHRDTPPKR